MSDGPKYRQRGYKDSEREEPRARSPFAPPPPKKDGPRGRGLGAPDESVFRCNACGEKRPLLDEIALDTVCGRCGAALHSCSNCVHFDTSHRWECRQVQALAARVAKKNAANDCAAFALKTVQEFAKDRDKPNTPSNDPRAAFDALFK
jgi:hypothetical protein